MTFPYLIPAKLMSQATAMTQHSEVPSPCLKLVWAKGPHEMSPSFPRKWGTQAMLRAAPNKEPGHGQAEHPESRGWAHTQSEPFSSITSFPASHPFSKDGTRPAGACNSAWDPHMPSRSLSPKCASCCHLGSGSSWCRIVRCYMDFNILMKLSSMCKRPLREIQSPVQMLHSAWLDLVEGFSLLQSQSSMLWTVLIVFDNI